MRKTGKGVMVYDGRWVSSSRDATWCNVTLCGAVLCDSVYHVMRRTPKRSRRRRLLGQPFAWPFHVSGCLGARTVAVSHRSVPSHDPHPPYPP